jgi:hypothetical protein
MPSSECSSDRKLHKQKCYYRVKVVTFRGLAVNSGEMPGSVLHEEEF